MIRSFLLFSALVLKSTFIFCEAPLAQGIAYSVESLSNKIVETSTSTGASRIIEAEEGTAFSDIEVPANGIAYISDLEGTVYEIDPSSDAVIKSIALFDFLPVAIAVNADASTVVVQDVNFPEKFASIDLATNQIEYFTWDVADMVDFDLDQDILIGVDGSTNTLHEMDLDTGVEQEIEVPDVAKLTAIAVLAGEALVADDAEQKVIRINTSTGRAIQVYAALSFDPDRLSASFDGTSWAVTEVGSPETVRLYETASGDLITTVTSAGTNLTGFSMGPLPSLTVSGASKKNVFLTQTEFFNVFSWSAPNVEAVIVRYQIFRNEELIASMPANAPRSFEDHNRRGNQTDVYSIVAENASGDAIARGNAAL